MTPVEYSRKFAKIIETTFFSLLSVRPKINGWDCFFHSVIAMWIWRLCMCFGVEVFQSEAGVV